MENNDYKIDKLAIIAEKEQMALKEFDSVIRSCESSPLAFLKTNYGFKKLRDRKTEPNISFLLSAAWTKISALAGLKTSTDIIISQDITNMIFNVYNDLSLEEIYKAFELERHCVYETKTEHFQQFNAEYVADILKKYKKWKQFTKIQHNISATNPESLLPEMTDSQKKETMDNAIIRKFNEYLSTNDIEEPFAYIFDELYERDIIKKPTKEDPEIQMYYVRKLEQAKIEIQKELESATSSVKSERITIKEELEKIAAGNSDKAQVRAKKIILMQFFKKHKTENTDFEKFIKDYAKPDNELPTEE